MPEISVVKNLPDVSFIDGATVEDIRGEMVADYEAFMSQATGCPLTLDRASPHRMELYAAAAQIYHALQYIDRAGKPGLLPITGAVPSTLATRTISAVSTPTAAPTTPTRTIPGARRPALPSNPPQRIPPPSRP